MMNNSAQVQDDFEGEISNLSHGKATMNPPAPMQEGVSLRVKLVLSYLGVALGAILLMVIVVAFSVQNYFYQSQLEQARTNAEDIARQVAQLYQQNDDNWYSMGTLMPQRQFLNVNLVIVDSQGVVHTALLPPNFAVYNTTLQQALTQALQGQETSGTLQGEQNDPNTFSGTYACAPIWYNNQIIGAVFFAQANRYHGFSPGDFLANVDKSLLITGIGLALAVTAFSLFMSRSLTRPLVSLTRAAEEMKAGNYAHRVDEPKSQDELGTLALTFNAMADKIAADVNELRQQEQLRRDLTANIAHDLVTPLTAIQGYSEAIADDVITSPAERHEVAQLIAREVQRLRRLVSDMQNMTSLESGRARLEIAPLNLHDLVTETLAVIAPECEQAEIKLRNEIDPAIPPVLADSDRITQVLLNLIDNARRHTPAGGTITLGARIDGPWLVAWVRDTGSGINPQDLPYIFERFYRVDRSRATSSGGSGLGLAIIKAIIVAHGGVTWAQSAPNQGTTIYFALPLAQVQVTPPNQIETAARPIRSK
ncbi:MAG TPA: HAMP domain-containing sensor histidine kinase [Ktedonobacteraceae bacterium]|jgi:two-component system sensor histidine kinase BaeS|nr:HAMP domain-containing sensor histidine kinase [Ktedonobacteraceae bacterium]